MELTEDLTQDDSEGHHKLSSSCDTQPNPMPSPETNTPSCQLELSSHDTQPNPQLSPLTSNDKQPNPPSSSGDEQLPEEVGHHNDMQHDP